MCRNELVYQPSKHASKTKRIISVDQINKIDDCNLVLKFCAFLAERCQFDQIVLFPSGSELFLREEELKNSIPLITNKAQFLETQEGTYWTSLNDLLEIAPFVVLFVHFPNLSNLNNSSKHRILNRIKDTFITKGIIIDQIGWIHQSYGNSGLLLILSKFFHKIGKPPKDFRVVALLTMKNEEDIIRQTIEHLNNQDVEVYIIDNWSTDKSLKIAQQMLGNGVIGVDKWPIVHSSEYFDLTGILKNEEELTRKIKANWFLHYDADEFRESPWNGVSLREAFWKVQNLGFNAVDFTILNFPPIDNSFSIGSSLLEHFKYCQFGNRVGHFNQVKAWKNQIQGVDLTSTGGHRVIFPNQKIFPYKFLTRHYPFRSLTQAENKILQERLPRLNPKEVNMGWHTHYKNINLRQDIIITTEKLLFFNNNFYSNFFIERLTGIGIKNAGFYCPKEQLQENNKMLRNQISELEQEILFYVQSESWKMTRPLRKLIRFLSLR